MDDTIIENELAVYREKLKQRKSTWLSFFTKYESTEDDLEISVDNLVEEFRLVGHTHTKRQGVKRGIKSTKGNNLKVNVARNKQGRFTKLKIPESVNCERCIKQESIVKKEIEESAINIQSGMVQRGRGRPPSKRTTAIIEEKISDKELKIETPKMNVVNVIKKKIGRPRKYEKIFDENDKELNSSKTVKNNIRLLEESKDVIAKVDCSSLKEIGENNQEVYIENGTKVLNNKECTNLTPEINASFKKRESSKRTNTSPINNQENLVGIPKKLGRPPKKMALGSNQETSRIGLCESTTINLRKNLSSSNVTSFKKRESSKRTNTSINKQKNLVGLPKKLGRPPSKKTALGSNQETSRTGLCESTTINLRKKPSSSNVRHSTLSEFSDTLSNETGHFKSHIDPNLLFNENSDPEMKDNCIEIKNGNASSNIFNFSEENAVLLDANVLNTKYIIEETLNSNIGSIMVKRLQSLQSNSVDPENTYAFWHNAVKAELIRLMKIISLDKLEKYLQWYINEWYK